MRSAHCEIRPGENVTLQYLSHDGRLAPRRASRRHRTARREGAAAGPPSMRRAAMRAAAVKCRTAAVDGGYAHGRRPEI
jgi:hypothetical protein